MKRAKEVQLQKWGGQEVKITLPASRRLASVETSQY